MRWSSSSRAGQKQAGQSLVEHALVVGMFFAVVLVVIELGYFFFAYAVVTNAASEGARIGAVSYPLGQTAVQGEIEAAARAAAISSLTRFGLDADAEATVTASLPSIEPGTSLQVDIVYNHQPFTGFLPVIPVTARATARLE